VELTQPYEQVLQRFMDFDAGKGKMDCATVVVEGVTGLGQCAVVRYVVAISRCFRSCFVAVLLLFCCCFVAVLLLLRKNGLRVRTNFTFYILCAMNGTLQVGR
jgi:hypothetical protein